MTGSIGVIMQLSQRRRADEENRRQAASTSKAASIRTSDRRFSRCLQKGARSCNRWSTTCMANSSPRWPKGEAWTRRRAQARRRPGLFRRASEEARFGRSIRDLARMPSSWPPSAPAWTASRQFTIPARNRSDGGSGYSWESSVAGCRVPSRRLAALRMVAVAACSERGSPAIQH